LLVIQNRPDTRPRAAAPLLLLLAACLAACRSSDTATAGTGDGTILIGVGAIPGSPGYDGVARGVELAVERLNAASAVRFRSRPPKPGSAGAVLIAQQLSADPQVIAVVGHPESGNTIETIPIYADAEHSGANGLVVISPTASSPQLSGVNPWFFRVAPSDNDAARVTAQWAFDSLGATRAAIIYRNDSYGRDWAGTFAQAFTRRGATVIAREPYLAGVTEWDAYAQLLATMRPDVVLFPGDATDALAFLRALKARGVTAPFIGGDGVEQINQHADAIGARYVAFFRADRATSPEALWFLSRYRERFRQDPDMFAALSYDAAIVMGRTIISGARTRAALRLALEKIGNGAPSVDGVAGRIAFERNHDIKGRRVVIVRVDRVHGSTDSAADRTDKPSGGAR
jgi:branched-chain amino acid transport system substrate-binding protein